MRLASFTPGIVLALTISAAFAQTQPAKTPASPPQAAKYSTSATSLGTLLEDPAAKAVLDKDVPQLMKAPDIATQASGMTLRDIRDALQAYSPDLLTDKILAQLDQDLAKVVPTKQ